jgi:hypothetical protein
LTSALKQALKPSRNAADEDILVEIHKNNEVHTVTAADWLAGNREVAVDTVQQWLDEAAKFSEADWARIDTLTSYSGVSADFIRSLLVNENDY